VLVSRDEARELTGQPVEQLLHVYDCQELVRQWPDGRREEAPDRARRVAVEPLRAALSRCGHRVRVIGRGFRASGEAMKSGGAGVVN
jgi:hypothetical protein